MLLYPGIKTQDESINFRKWKIAYEILMFLLALAVAVILYLEFTHNLSASQEILLHRFDLAILIVFAADYFIRFHFAKDKVEFFKKNILDLIAIIPFDMTFRAARLARLARIGRLFRLLRVGAPVFQPIGLAECRANKKAQPH